MSETPEHSPLENQPSQEASLPSEVPPSPAASPEPVVRHLPDSPVERARLEAQGKIPVHNEINDRSTQVAFALLFVVPLLIIIFAVLLLLPFINAQLTQSPDPSGVTTQSSPNQLPPQRQ